MPRGRHRHSPPLHRILPPSAVAAAAVLCAAGAWFLPDPVVLRGLVTAAAAAAVTGGVLMRSWDREAGRRVAELLRARASDEWKTEERLAELEGDIDESRDMRAKLDGRLRAKRAELAKLRGEHAALLRRYATAETGRATALEGRRQLALEAAREPKALPRAGSTPTASVYFRAARALEDLTRNGVAQHTGRILEEARSRELAARAAREAAEKARRAEPAKEAAQEQAAAAAEHTRPSAALAPRTRPAALPATRSQAASAIVPYSRRHRLQRGPEGGFDFFGTQKDGSAEIEPPGADGATEGGADSSQDGPAGAGSAPDSARRAAGRPVPAQLERVQREDLADVVGEEVLAVQRRSEDRAVGQVIDLTEHDDTEDEGSGQLRPSELRSAIST